MKRMIIAGAIATAAMFGPSSAAGAVDDHAPHGGSSSHPHHIHVGSGACIDLDGPDFEITARGRHRGATESGADHGMHHSTCAAHGS